MFSVQPETAVASYSSARQKPGRGDQPSGPDDFGALVDSNASTADTGRPVDNQSNAPARRDERQVKQADASDGSESTRPAKPDNPDQNTKVAGGKKQTKASGKDAAEKPDAAKTTVDDKAGGKIKAVRDAEDVTDTVATDQAAATAASAIIPAAPMAVAIATASVPAAAPAGETAASDASAIAAAVTSATSAAKTEIASKAAAKTAQSTASSATSSPGQTSADAITQAAAQAATDKATAENTPGVAQQSDDAKTTAPANGKVADDPSAMLPQALNAGASETTLANGIELTASAGPAPVLPNGKTTAPSTVKSAALTKADAKGEASQTVPAGKGKEAKTAATVQAAGETDAGDTDAKAVKDSKDSDDAKAAAPDKTAPAAREPRIATQPLTSDPSLQPASAQQQTTQLQPSNTPATPAAQLNATLAAANTPVPLNSLAVDIALKAAGGNSRFEIRLDPAELGRIDVRLDVDKHGQVTSHLTVERPATLDMLRKDAPQLQQALEDAGLKTGDGGLQFSLRDQSSFSGQQNDGQSGRYSQRLIVTEDTPVPAQVAGQTYGRARGSRSGVDISI